MYTYIYTLRGTAAVSAKSLCSMLGSSRMWCLRMWSLIVTVTISFDTNDFIHDNLIIV